MVFTRKYWGLTTVPALTLRCRSACLRAQLIRVISAILVIFTATLTAQAEDQPATEAPRVLYVIAGNDVGDSFWYETLLKHATLASDALDITLEPLFAGTVRPVVLERVQKRLRTEPKPDYVVFGNQSGLGLSLLKVAEREKTNAFLYISPLSDEEYEAVGRPRETLKHWIGELIPDDKQVGFDLANILIDAALEKRRDSSETDPIRILGIEGRKSNQASHQRKIGLMRAVEERNDAELLQIVSARWSGSTAAQKYELLINRWGAVDVVWAANDPMAMGILEAVRDQTRKPLIGGIDWEPPAVDAVDRGDLVVSMGGHSFDIAYVLALLHHHHHGQDFVDYTQTASLTSEFTALTPKDVNDHRYYKALLNGGALNFSAGFEGLLTDPVALMPVRQDRFIRQALNADKGGT